jgi:hypothetical protein
MLKTKDIALGAAVLALALSARADEAPAPGAAASREVVLRVEGLACPAVQGLG